MAFEEAPIICKVCEKLIEFNEPGEKYFVRVLQEGKGDYEYYKRLLRGLQAHVMQSYLDLIWSNRYRSIHLKIAKSYRNSI